MSCGVDQSTDRRQALKAKGSSIAQKNGDTCLLPTEFTSRYSRLAEERNVKDKEHLKNMETSRIHFYQLQDDTKRLFRLTICKNFEREREQRSKNAAILKGEATIVSCFAGSLNSE